MYSFLAWTSEILLLVLGLFLIIVILLQRGRGGGLAGAFGGMGGQSAFGTKAGDVFTRITIVVAILWVVVSGGSGYFLRAAAEQKGAQFGAAPAEKGGLDPAVLEKTDRKGVLQPPQPPAGTSTDGAAAPTGENKPADANGAATPPTDGAAPATEPNKPATSEAEKPATEPAPAGDAPKPN
jgi:preprotein translocase subunit SecG